MHFSTRNIPLTELNLSVCLLCLIYIYRFQELNHQTFRLLQLPSAGAKSAVFFDVLGMNTTLYLKCSIYFRLNLIPKTSHGMFWSSTGNVPKGALAEPVSDVLEWLHFMTSSLFFKDLTNSLWNSWRLRRHVLVIKWKCSQRGPSGTGHGVPERTNISNYAQMFTMNHFHTFYIKITML